MMALISLLSLARFAAISPTRRRIRFASRKYSDSHFMYPTLSSQGGSETSLHVNHQSVDIDSTDQYNIPLSSKFGKYQAGDRFDPNLLCNGDIPLPVSLSPSSAAEFKACPQSFLFQYIYGIKLPTNPTLAKGTMCHKALEQIFELKPEDRTLLNLQNLLRRHWSQQRQLEDYRHLFSKREGSDVPTNSTTDLILDSDDYRDLDAEREWGLSALKLLSNYYVLEDPRLVPRPNPIEREMWVSANLSLNAGFGVTGYTSTSSFESTLAEEQDNSTFFVRGIVDRLDVIVIPTNTSSPSEDSLNNQNKTELALRIVDYKTGKAPDLKYSRVMNEKIANDSLWQLKIYALLLREMCAKGKCYSPTGNLYQVSNIPLRFLRLMYLNSSSDKAKYIEMDLGESQEERDFILHTIHCELSDIWKKIRSLVQLKDARAFVHCDRPWCTCHILRDKFVPGSVWSRDYTRE